MSKYGVVLLSICLLDTTGTFCGIYTGIFGELNPILNYFLINWGLAGFVLSKIFIFVILPILIFEITFKLNLLSRKRIKNYYIFTIVAYLLILAGGILFQAML